MNNHNAYCVILAGGKGRRLWPCSREQFPKQFEDFFGVGRTQLQQTFDRFSEFIETDHIYVITNRDYEGLVREQLPQLPNSNLLSETVHRNTAPSVAWATHRIMHQNKDACIIVSPSDQAVQNAEAFRNSVDKAFRFVETHDVLLSLGVIPTRPEPGYGYIQKGDVVEEHVYRAKSFTEKPEREFARMFMSSGEFLWNTGIFLANVHFLRERFMQILPPVFRGFDAQESDYSLARESAFVAENFSRFPNLSIDFGILDKVDGVCVMQCNFGWADLGTWHSIYEAMQRGEGDNVCIDSDVMFDKSHNNVVKLPKGRFAVINGLDGFIVAEQGNVLLICKKEDSSALVRKYVNEVQLLKGDEYI